MVVSAGILAYRLKEGTPEVFLVHPGGPYFSKKDMGWWTIPKGLINPGEEPLGAAIREFAEETGTTLTGDFITLHPIIQKGGKKVLCWALECSLDETAIKSNAFELEWPPRSGKTKLFPEIDKAGWFGIEKARTMINERQIPLLEELKAIIQNKDS